MGKEEAIEDLNMLLKAQGHEGKVVNMDDELSDLLKIYTDAESHLKRKEDSALENATRYNKSYIEALEERKNVSVKLANLKDKLNHEKQCEECEEES